LTVLLKQRGWQRDNSDIVPRFSYSTPEKPIEASATESKGLGWVATIEGQHQVSTRMMEFGAHMIVCYLMTTAFMDFLIS